jgi:hypothetical protein
MSRRSHGTTQSTPRANPPAPRARHAAVPTSPRACSVQQQAHVSARHPCGRRDPVSQGRAHLRRSALGRRSGTPRRRIFLQRCIQLRAAGMSMRACCRCKRKMCQTRHSACAADSPHVLADREKSTGPLPSSRGRQRAPLVHTAARACLRKCQKGAMQCMQGGAVGRRAPHVSRLSGASRTGLTVSPSSADSSC